MENDKSSRRQLAAIMFTDIAGYTALMQSDEDLAASSLSRYRSTLAEGLAQHDGILLQHMGDGSLTMFQSVSAGRGAFLRPVGSHAGADVPYHRCLGR
jgi:class 3 adenylate cyclase